MAKKTTAKTEKNKIKDDAGLQEAIKRGLTNANKKLRDPNNKKYVKKAWAGGMCDFIAKQKDMTSEEHEKCVESVNNLNMVAPIPRSDPDFSRVNNMKYSQHVARGQAGGKQNRTPEGKARIAAGMLATARIGKTKADRKAERFPDST